MQARTVRSHICSKTDFEEFLEWRKKIQHLLQIQAHKGCCTQKGSLCLLEMEMTDFNCNKEGGYTLEKLFNLWGILALELSPLNSYGIFNGASFQVKNKTTPAPKKNTHPDPPNNSTNQKNPHQNQVSRLK